MVEVPIAIGIEMVEALKGRNKSTMDAVHGSKMSYPSNVEPFNGVK